MKKLLIATHNPAKINEITAGLEPLIKKGIQILSLADINIQEEPEETGTTFEENAKLKAEFYGNLSNLPVISDDGGISIDALNGEPGVYSKTWPGYAASDEELINLTLRKLAGVPVAKRTAKFIVCLCFYDPTSKKSEIEIENEPGYIAEKPSKRLIHRFPYRSVFIISEFNKYYTELNDKEQAQVNHRLKALKRLSKKIEEYLLK